MHNDDRRHKDRASPMRLLDSRLTKLSFSKTTTFSGAKEAAKSEI